MRFSNQSDERLLKDAAAGHFSAYEELVQRHQQRLLNYFWRMIGSRAEAETLFEETWVDLYKLRNSGNSNAGVAILLFGMATRKAIRVAMENPPPRDEMAASGSFWRQPSQLAKRSAQLNTAILGLPLKERAAVLLTVFDSLSAAAMAACVNEREDTALSLAEAGKKKLILSLGADYASADSLKALALEASLDPDKALIRRSLQATRRLDVSERLIQTTGEDAARQILLNRQPAKKSKTLNPGTYAILAVLAGLGFFYFGSQKPLPEKPSVPASAIKAILAQDSEAMTTPSLSAKEKAQESELDSKARHMLFSQLSHEKPAQAPVAPVVTPLPIATPRPNPSPTHQTKTVAAAAHKTRKAASKKTVTPATDIAPPSFSLNQSKLSLSNHDKINFYMLLPEKDQVELRIFDTSGRTVRLLADGLSGPGDLNLSFDGKSDSGAKLAPGTYYARAMTRWFSRVEAIELKP